jgi:putative addiction module component (TIGR02574 family)
MKRLQLSASVARNDPANSCDIISAVSVPILPLNEMSVEEKLQTMEALWQSLSSDPATVESPAWHQEELAERERKIESGEAKFVEWEKAKADIRRRTS